MIREVQKLVWKTYLWLLLHNPSLLLMASTLSLSAVTENNVDEAFMALAKSIRLHFDPKEGKTSLDTSV
jgi:hypothetical protein